MRTTQNIFQLKLRYPFGITREVRTESPTVLFRLGDAGHGEGVPVRYKKQTPEQVIAGLEKLGPQVTESNIDDIEGLESWARRQEGVVSAAIMAFDIALWDARGRRQKKPIHQLVGTPKPTTLTTYTVSLSDNETMELRAREAAHLPFLKIKLGRDLETDIDAMRRIRRVAPNATLRVDANAGWSVETALAIIPKLEDLGVEFIEQPLPIGDLDGLQTVTRNSNLPIIADEDAQNLASLPSLRERVSGINIKLSKCGGISEALRMIKFAREEGWSILVGCMLETRLGLGAASQIAGLVDYMDVDAHMLTTNDPYPPGSLSEFSASLPLSDGPGVGLPFI